MTEEKETFRDIIIKSSIVVFNRYGYKKTTMDDIAQSVGKGKSSIYYYFKSKEDIFKAVVEFEAEIMREELLNSVESANEPIEKIRNYVLTRMKVYKKVNNFYKVITNDNLLHLNFINEMRRKYENQEVELVQEIVEKGIALDLFELEEPNFVAIALVTALKGLELPYFNIHEQQSFENRLDQLLKVLFMGIIKR